MVSFRLYEELKELIILLPNSTGIYEGSSLALWFIRYCCHWKLESSALVVLKQFLRPGDDIPVCSSDILVNFLADVLLFGYYCY